MSPVDAGPADPPEVLGMLENDDTLPPEKRIPHREVGLGGERRSDLIHFLMLHRPAGSIVALLGQI